MELYGCLTQDEWRGCAVSWQLLRGSCFSHSTSRADHIFRGSALIYAQGTFPCWAGVLWAGRLSAVLSPTNQTQPRASTHPVTAMPIEPAGLPVNQLMFPLSSFSTIHVYFPPTQGPWNTVSSLEMSLETLCPPFLYRTSHPRRIWP